MPGAVPVTSSHALNNAVLPYGLVLADKGVQRALEDDAGLRMGLNIRNGKIIHPRVIESFTGAVGP